MQTEPPGPSLMLSLCQDATNTVGCNVGSEGVRVGRTGGASFLNSPSSATGGRATPAEFRDQGHGCHWVHRTKPPADRGLQRGLASLPLRRRE